MEQKFDFEDEIAFDSAIESKKMNMEEIDKKMQQLAERKMAQHYMAGISWGFRLKNSLKFIELFKKNGSLFVV